MNSRNGLELSITVRTFKKLVLISKVYKTLIQLQSRKPSNLIKKMDRRSEKTFFQGRLTDGQQAHEKMISIINHQGNENQNSSEVALLFCWVYHLTPVKMTVFKKTRNYRCWQGLEKKEPSNTVVGNINWCNHCRNSMEGPQQIKPRTAIWFGPTSGYLSEENKSTNSKRDMLPHSL